MPRLSAVPSGCSFHPRCGHVISRCREETPPLAASNNGVAACWRLLEPKGRMLNWQPSIVPAPETVNIIGRDERPLVEVENVSQHFDLSPPLIERMVTRAGRVDLKAVDDVSFSIQRGETFAVVGESGCGKSTLARMIVGLYRPTRGAVRFDGHDVLTMRPQRRFQMIFQDPYASLNPRWRAADIIAEPIRTHGMDVGSGVKRRVDALLEMVGLSSMDGNRYPHEFSGGQRQRISIARALASEPEFIVCDEPTSALDVSVQAQILNLMKDLQDDLKLTLLLISHNLAVVQHMADRVGVMYLGRMVELAPAAELFGNPRHPYTRMLLDAIPDIDMTGRVRTRPSGEMGDPANPPAGCGFNPRCSVAHETCRKQQPMLRAISDRSSAACHAVGDTAWMDTLPLHSDAGSHAVSK